MAGTQPAPGLEEVVSKSHVRAWNAKLPIAELIGNEGPVLFRKSVHISQCSVWDDVSPRLLCCSAPQLQGVSGMHAIESNPLGYSLKLPAQSAHARASSAGSRGDKCREYSCCLFCGTRSLRSRLEENSSACEEPVHLNPSGGEPTVVEGKVRTLIDSFPSNRELTHVPFEVIAR